MIRPLAFLRLRQLRWVALAAAVPVLWACNARTLAKPSGEPRAVVNNRFQQSVNRDLDLLLLVDDSLSMAPLQAKMRARIPDFMNVLKALPGGLPNLHVAVVSSSLGAGKFGNVNGCQPGTRGNMDGQFMVLPGCTGLMPGNTYIKSIARPGGGREENFTGDITDVFACMANIGDQGCGFEHQFESVRLALQKTTLAGNTNAGFLRPEAYLAVIMVTNEDDCSVPADSDLFDPNMQTLADPYGGLQSYRCNEFGHVCGDGNGTPPPHGAPGMPVTLNNCRSSEGAGKLVTVQGFTDFLKSLKPGRPEQILVAAIAGLPDRYIVEARDFVTATGSMERQPSIQHSCTQNSGEYADPGVRIKEWLDGFGANAVMESICADDFSRAMVNIARTISARLGGQCVTGPIANKSGSDEPDCDVTEQSKDGSGNPVVRQIEMCQNNRANAPCWEFRTGAQAPECPGGDNRLLALCYDAACSEAAKPQTSTDARISCSRPPAMP